MKRKTPTRDELHNIGSLITYLAKEGDEQETCLGDLMHFNDHGTYDATFGLVDVTEEEAKLHNQALDEARLKGMDDLCEVGQGGSFYLSKAAAIAANAASWSQIGGTQKMHNQKVTTFMGTVVSTDVEITGKTITFRRNNKVYRGRLSKDADAFNFKRVS